MWLVYSILTTLSWGFADLFYKKGNAPNDKSSHIKTVVMVGVVMGIHAFAYMIIKDVPFSLRYLIIYLPVSFMYILSMAIGYFGLRYIELSISSPVQNSSGAVTAILIYIFFTHRLSFIEISAIILITVGIVALAFFERRSDADAIPHREEDKKYRIGFLAIIFPILYCIIDGLGTFADAVYLDELSLIGEDQALLAYEFTFFIVAVIAIIYLFAKGERISFKGEEGQGACCCFRDFGSVLLRLCHGAECNYRCTASGILQRSCSSAITNLPQGEVNDSAVYHDNHCYAGYRHVGGFRGFVDPKLHSVCLISIIGPSIT